MNNDTKQLRKRLPELFLLFVKMGVSFQIALDNCISDVYNVVETPTVKYCRKYILSGRSGENPAYLGKKSGNLLYIM